MITEHSRKKLEFAKIKVVAILKSIPALRGIAVYGSVADGMARPDSDIDLLVVCEDGFLHLCRWQVAWRLWRAGLRSKVSAGVIVAKSALKPETFQYNKNDKYAKQWFNGLKWIYITDKTSQVTGRMLNALAKQFFSIRFFFDRMRRYPAPHIKFSDQVFFHFGDAISKKS